MSDKFLAQLREHGRSFFTNWSDYDASFGEKAKLFAKNRAKAMRTGCCGNHGQPGC